MSEPWKKEFARSVDHLHSPLKTLAEGYIRRKRHAVCKPYGGKMDPSAIAAGPFASEGLTPVF